MPKQKWEYAAVHFSDKKNANDWALKTSNKYGANGWRLHTMHFDLSGLLLVFEREVIEADEIKSTPKEKT